MKRATLAAAACASALLLVAPDALAARWFVPGSAKVRGASNSDFRTDLTLLNPSTAATVASVTFLPSGTDNTGLPGTVSVNVPAAAQVTLTDVVGTTFGRDGVGGALLVDSSVTTLVVTSRTYNKLPDKTYGMSIPGVPEASALPANEAGHISFLAKSDVYRSNVAFANTTGQAGRVKVRLYGSGGELLGETPEADLLPYGQYQFNDVFGVAGAAATTAARAEVTATVPVVAFASIIDGRTNDPFAVIAERVTAATTDAMLTSAARVSGANDARFRSDVRIANPGSSPTTVTVSLYANASSPGAGLTRTVNVGARGLVALDDLILSLFGLEVGYGAVRFTSPQPVFVMSRTYNDAPEGTSGQELPGVPVSSYVTVDDTARLPALSGSGFRANVIFVNAGTAALEGTLTFKGTDGTTGATPVNVPGTGQVQLNDVLGALGVSGKSGYLEVVATHGGPYWVVVTIIDNGSNDPTQIGAQVERHTQVPAGGACFTYRHPGEGSAVTLGVSGANTGTLSYNYYNVTATTVTSDSSQMISGSSSAATTIQTYGTSSFGGEDFISVSRIEVRSSVPVLGTLTVVNVFSTPFLSGPKEICGGKVYNLPATPGTQTTTPPGVSSASTALARKLEILSANEQVTVPAGTFATYHTKATASDGTITEVWTDRPTGLIAKQVSTGTNGTTTYQATSLR